MTGKIVQILYSSDLMVDLTKILSISAVENLQNPSNAKGRKVDFDFALVRLRAQI